MLGEQDHKRHLLPLLRDMEEKLQKRPKAEANTNRFNHIRANAMRSKNDDGDIILTFHTVSGRPERTKGKGQGGQRRRGPKVMESVDREFAAGAGKGGGKGRGGGGGGGQIGTGGGGGGGGGRGHHRRGGAVAGAAARNFVMGAPVTGDVRRK